MKELEFSGVSPSKLRLYLLCPRQYYYAYAEGIFIKETKELLFGKYVHAVVEDYIKHLVKTFQSQDMEALYGIVSRRKKEYDKLPENGDLSFFEADVLLNRFASVKVNPQRVYAVEKYFRLPFIDDSRVHIEGRMDRIDIEYKKGGDRLLHIIDYKTGSNKLTEEELKEDLQMKFYVLGAYYLYRELFKEFRFTLFYLKDNTKVSFETDYENTYRTRIGEYIKTMKEDKNFKKSIGRHCLRCPALKPCDPDLKGLVQ